MSTIADLPSSYLCLYRDPLTVDASGEGYQSSMTFAVPLADLVAFCAAVGGTSETITTSWGSMSRVVTLQHPLYSALYATGLRAVAFGTPSETSEAPGDLWSHAKIRVEFATRPFGFSGDSAFLSWNVDQGSTYTTIPGRKFKFTSGEPVDADAGFQIVQNSYVLTLFQLPSIDFDLIDSLSGKVNSTAFMGKAAGKLFFGGCRSTESQTIGGVVQRQASLLFQYQSHEWNKIYQRSGVLGSPVDPAGNPPYESDNFFQLIG